MLKKHLKTPVGKALCVLVVAVLFIEVLGLAHWGGVVGFFAQSILFPIGLVIGLALAIAVITGIFFAAVFMADKELARQFWQQLKGKCPCCAN